MKAVFKKHPEIDFFIGLFDGPAIPTKQDKFKPLIGYKVIIDDNEKEQSLEGFDVYLKKKDTNSIRAFEEHFRQIIKDNLTNEHPYTVDKKIEMIIDISMDKKRIDKVDIDNLSKSIIDCFKGLVFSDDSQIISLYAHKTVQPLVKVNGLMVGIRKLNDKNKSWFSEIKFGYFDYED